jgi:Glycosyl hydrolases family 18
MADQTYTAFWLGYEPSGPGDGPTLPQTPPYIDVLVLAFANLFPGNTTCQEFLQKANSGDSIRAGIAALRQSSPTLKIMLSIIGTPSPAVGWNTGITDPDAFGAWCADLAERWDLDGFDIDNEDLDSFPGDAFCKTVQGMRKAMPQALLTMDTYLFDRDSAVIKTLAPCLDGINTMSYFSHLDQMKTLVEQYSTVIPTSKISIGVKSDKVGSITQGTSLADTAALSAWSPPAGTKRGMMLWNLSQDLQRVTGEPDGAWTRTIHANLP